MLLRLCYGSGQIFDPVSTVFGAVADDPLSTLAYTNTNDKIDNNPTK